MFTAALGCGFCMYLLLISARTGQSSSPVRTKTPSACPGRRDFLALLGGPGRAGQPAAGRESRPALLAWLYLSTQVWVLVTKSQRWREALHLERSWWYLSPRLDIGLDQGSLLCY